MIANAMAIVSRQFDEQQDSNISVSGLKVMADRIRNGDGTPADYAQLVAATKATLWTSNPRALS